MNTRTFLKCTAVVASFLCVSAFQAVAQAQGGGGRGGMGVLTQEQRTSMREAIQDELTPLMEKLAVAQKKAVKVAMADNASEASVKAELKAVQEIQTEIAVLRFKGLKKIASTLTADQKSQLESARDGGYSALFGMMGGGRGARGGGGGGNN